jgi:hypothetical protein
MDFSIGLACLDSWNKACCACFNSASRLMLNAGMKNSDQVPIVPHYEHALPYELLQLVADIGILATLTEPAGGVQG